MKLKLHGYQERAVQDLVRDPHHALFMDPGLGKTVIVLEAFLRLRDELDVSSMLVVAPLRVCQLVWPGEVQKWARFNGLSLNYMPDDVLAPRDGADIYLINPEQISWLFGKAVAIESKNGRRRMVWRPGPWRDWRNRPDMLVIDEISKLKRSSGVRNRTLKRYINDFGRRVALTGSPAPNGLLDLHGQMLLVDGGRALDPRVTYFRDAYFNETIVGRGTHKYPKYDLKPGSEEAILAAIADRVTALRAEDWLQLPDLIHVDVPVYLPQEVGIAVGELLNDAATEIADLELINDGPSLTRVRQLVNGIAYDGVPFEPKKTWKVVHEAKLDALEDLLGEIGRPAVVAYEFRCEREEITKRLRRIGHRVGVLGGGIRRQDAVTAVKAWSAGELDELLVHPQAAGHGLNLQDGGNVVVWFGPTWDLELYQQLNARLHRQGQRAEKVLIYHLVAVGTPDRKIARAIQKKDATQERVFEALKEGDHGWEMSIL